jgi:hypothetical protein
MKNPLIIAGGGGGVIADSNLLIENIKNNKIGHNLLL